MIALPVIEQSFLSGGQFLILFGVIDPGGGEMGLAGRLTVLCGGCAPYLGVPPCLLPILGGYNAASQSQSQLSPGGWEAALHNLHPSPSPCIVLQAAGLHGPRVSKLGTKPELAFFIFQAFLVDRCQRRKRKMATSAFNPYRPPEHGLVSFVLSNLLPAKKDESKDNDRTRMGHKEVDVDVDLEMAMRIQQEQDIRGVVSRGQGRHRTG